MKDHKFLAITMLMIAATLLLSTFAVVASNAAIPSTVGFLEGPYFQQIQFKIYSTAEAETAGLLTGEIDVLDFFEADRLPDIQAGITNQILTYTQSAEQGMWVFLIQCQRYPLNITQFRRALAHLVDKDTIVADGLGGLAYPIDTFLGSPGYGPWSGTDYATYEFNVTMAGRILDSLGFVRGSGGWRLDPRTGTTMREIDILARTEHPHRLFSARQLKAQMDAVGIPNKLEEVSKSVASSRVMFEQDYDVYTAGWGGGPDIDWVYDLFHSMSPPEQNWSLFENTTVDGALNMLKFGSNYTTVLQGAHDAQKYLSEQVPFIPLYAKAYVSPYNTRLKNVVDLPWRQGVTNWMTFFYARDTLTTYGGTLNVGWLSDPHQPSPMYEINWWWDGMLVDTVYEFLINADPTSLREIPWLAESWTVEPWTAPGSVPGLKITFNLVDNATWHDGTALTAEDVVFTWKYAQQQRNPVYLSYLLNLVEATAPSHTTAVAYLNTTSYWALHWLGENIPIIPKSLWKDIGDSTHYQPVKDGKMIGSGPYRFKENKPGEYVLLEAYPNYWRKPTDNTVTYPLVTLSAEGFLRAGDTQTYTKTATVQGKPVTNGTFTLTVLTSTGDVVKTVTGTVAADGTYSAKLDTTGLPPGTYIVSVDLKAPATEVGLGSSDKYRLVVEESPPNYAVIIVMLLILIASVLAVVIVLRRRGSWRF